MNFVNLLLNSFETYPIIYKGKGVSWNEIYGSNNWGTRKGLADKFKKTFFYLIKEAKIPWCNEFGVVLYYNSRTDPDNTSCMVKFFFDTLKQERESGKIIKEGWVYDDSKKYCKGIFIIPDESLDNNTYKFVLVKLK